MALKLHFPEHEIPDLIEGTLDGAIPVRVEKDDDSWMISIGTWIHQAPAKALTSVRDLRGTVYHAVARYRMRDRGILPA